MFESLSGRFEEILGRLRSRGRLSPQDVDEALGEIRRALLAADVALPVVAAFRERVRERALAADLHRALNPAQQVVGIVREELARTLGGETMAIKFASRPPTIVLLVGLQGSGKTTAAAKLARWFRSKGRSPLLVAADLTRPAAIEQLRVLGSEIGVPVYSATGKTAAASQAADPAPDSAPATASPAAGTGASAADPKSDRGHDPASDQPVDPVAVAQAGLAEARRLGRDVVICDTAGRQVVDDGLMAEISSVAAAIEPHYTFLVLDAMVGQEAVRVGESFGAALGLDAMILTKLDGDARGGAALSVREVVGVPVAFVSTGERLAHFDVFHPDRLAGRILGLGDLASLAEKAEEAARGTEAEASAERVLAGDFTLDDFLEQMRQLRKLGGLEDVLSHLPGAQAADAAGAGVDDRRIGRMEAMICSMTPAERTQPALIDGSRRRRIAAGSGTTTGEVGELLRNFNSVRRMMRSGAMGAGGPGGGRKRAKGGKGRKGGKGSGGRGTARRSRVTPAGRAMSPAQRRMLAQFEEFEATEAAPVARKGAKGGESGTQPVEKSPSPLSWPGA